MFICHSLQAGGDSGRYQRPDFAAALATQPNEYSYWITEIEGEVPSSLRGTLFRNGPGRLIPLLHGTAVVLVSSCPAMCLSMLCVYWTSADTAAMSPESFAYKISTPCIGTMYLLADAACCQQCLMCVAWQV